MKFRRDKARQNSFLYANAIWAPGIVVLVIALGIFSGCKSENSEKDVLTVGIINPVDSLTECVSGFTDGMKDQGFVVGKSIQYVPETPGSGSEAIRTAIGRLIAKKVDLIFVLTTIATVPTAEMTKGTGIPVVFALVSYPVQSGILKNTGSPEGNVTGVSDGGASGPAIRWLKEIDPRVKVVLIPFQKDDTMCKLMLSHARQAAESLGIEVIAPEVANIADILNVLEDLPAEVDAVQILPVPLLVDMHDAIVTAANKRKIPVLVSGTHQLRRTPEALMSYGFEIYPCGKQAARLAAGLLEGTLVNDLPVERTEFFLGINMKAVKALGMHVSDDILSQADIIIR